MDENEHTSAPMEEETQETTAPVEAEAAVEEAWEAADQPRETDPEAEREETHAQTQIRTEDGMELKYMGEIHRVAREEAVTLAQKGMDYDRIRSERDELREYRAQALPALTLVERMAKRSGMSTDAYLDHCQQNLGGVDPAGGDWREKSRSDVRERDMRDFITDFPDVKPESIPKEVWSAVAGGRSLTAAYGAHRLRTLEADLAAREQEGRNRERSMGSMMESAPGDGGDLISKWWREA